jgi:probable rRNA maturation factor
VKVFVQNLQKKIPIEPKKIKASVLKVLQIEGTKKTGQINLLFVTDKKIRELNLKYLGKKSATDVLSFDISASRGKILADIVISADAAVRNARIFGTLPPYEMHLYAIHGLLHLLGYDDKRKKDKIKMQKREEYLLKILGIPACRQVTYNLMLKCQYTRPKP